MFRRSIILLWSCWAVSSTGGGSLPASDFVDWSSPRAGVRSASTDRAKPRNHRLDRIAVSDICYPRLGPSLRLQPAGEPRQRLLAHGRRVDVSGVLVANA